TQSPLNHLGLISLVAVAVLSASSAVGAWADEPTGLQGAAALEEALVSTIAQVEKSIVAIARVNPEPGQLEIAPDLLGRPRIGGPPRPGDANFIPNDYATGVVVGADGLILTTNHVLRQGSKYFVTAANRRVYRAVVKATDPRGDLAVLKIEAE